MKIRCLLFLCFVCILSACASSSKPDSIVEEANRVTATKRIADSDFELRLVAERIDEDDNMFELEAGIRYIGDQPEIEIMHGDPLISSSIIIEGEEIGGPSVVITIGIFTTLKANEWHTQDITLQSSRTQIKQFYEKDGKITINAGFSADGYTYEQKDNAFLSLKAEDIPR